MSYQQQPLAKRQRRGAIASAFCLFVCALVCGCQTLPKVYPEPQRKSLTELYYDAVATAQNAPDRSGMVVNSGPLTMAAPPQTILPPVDATIESPPSSLTPIVPEGSTNENENTISVPLLAPETSALGGDKAGGWQKSGGQRNANAQKTQLASHTTAEPIATVTEFFEDTDIRQALQSLAQQAEATIIIDEQVAGVVTAVIEDEAFETALRKVLLPLGLVYSQTDSGDILVGIPDPASPMFSQLSIRKDYRPLHLSPEELAALVPERDKKFIQVIEARNRILIEAPKDIAERLAERLQQFDTPIPQVELEAIVCVVSPDKGFKSGLDWGHALTLNGSEVFNFGLAGLAFSGTGSGAGFNNAFSDFSVTSAFVKLLAQEGYLAIRAAPRVMARDGDQAQISIKRQSFFSTQPQSDTAFFRQEIEEVEAGIELDITPIIRGDNITVKIEKAEVSEDIRTSQINSGITENPFPQINRRTVSTTVHVKDGETVVIGGLVQRQVVDRIAKVPWLGDLPGIGRMFQTVEQKEQDAEVVIFISPRLVHPQQDLPNQSNVVIP